MARMVGVRRPAESPKPLPSLLLRLTGPLALSVPCQERQRLRVRRRVHVVELSSDPIQIRKGEQAPRACSHRLFPRH
jgi:hypothetical protein